MASIQYIGMDVHKKTIAYCIKTRGGSIREEGVIAATRHGLTQWLQKRRQPWIGAMEATLFTGWIYDLLKPHARELKVAHPQMVKAIIAGKKKNDRADARMLADLLRTDLLPECYMACEQVRQLRRMLRFRNLMVQQSTRMKNRISGLLMEVGASYDKKKLHGKAHFHAMIDNLHDIPESVRELLLISRGSVEMFQAIQKRLLAQLRGNPTLSRRVDRLMTIPGVGEVLALTWALEIDDVHRFGSIRQAISYCGLCCAQHQSAGKEQRSPISKQRNGHLQCILVEAAKLAPRWNPALAQIHQRELARGNRNRATLAVARKLVAFLMAVDKNQSDYELRLKMAA